MLLLWGDFVNKFCEIGTRKEFAEFIGVSLKKLTYLLYVKHVDNYYHSFEIPKRSGGSRQIDAPIGDLKKIQYSLADKLWEHQKIVWRENNIYPKVSHAFIKGKSIITNAKVHRNRRFVINLDLEDFFGGFHFGRVRGFFQKNRYFSLPIEIATIISQLTCYKGHLPQGAPTSPIITNFLCQTLDYRLIKLSKKYGLNYTRYADDLTFSTNRNFVDIQGNVLLEIEQEVGKFGFHLNRKKTRIQFNDSRQVVTGLVVNKKINVDRNYYRETRAMADKLYKTGCFSINDSYGDIKQLEGRFSYINQLNWYNNQLDDEKHNLYSLKGREKQYQKFLFYKYFWGNEKPLIITEGKTDIIYLKSALKKLYKQYPNLVNKKDDVFQFNLSFLNRTKRLKYFFGIEKDGADTMAGVYNKFWSSDKNKNTIDYINYFRTYAKQKTNKPIILLFDNEFKKGKPLYKFAESTGLKNRIQGMLKDKKRRLLYIKLREDYNLFLLTMKLPEGKEECEIEDLFDEKTLGHEDKNGKNFSRGSKFDNSKYYGKACFSQYILQNYQNINFDKFQNMLESIQQIVSGYRVAIRDLGVHGEGIGSVDGFTIFVPGALPGETVTAEITLLKKSYALGELLSIEWESPFRVVPKCPVYENCGGCQLSHLTYEGQLDMKYRRVKDVIERIAGESGDLVRPVLPAAHPFAYRNKMAVPAGLVKGKAALGCYRQGSHDIIPVSSCAIQKEENNRLLQFARRFIEKYRISVYNEKTRKGNLRHVMGRVGDDGKVMAVLVTASETLPEEKRWIEEIKKELPEVVSLWHNIQPKPGNTILGAKIRHLWGRETLTASLCGLRFEVSPYSFFQVHKEQAEVLYEKALEYADLKGGETVIDAYCGTGTISLCLAKKAKRVIGIEIVKPAIEDAKKNAKKNHMENTEFYAADAGKLMPQLYRKGLVPDVIVMDPVRAGCSGEVLKAAAGMKPKRIVYVSCNPATFARDAKILKSEGYEIKKVQPVDMFPQTMHVETVALMIPGND